MKKTKLIVAKFICLGILLSSCGTSDDVVNNSFFQKRKYRKGYHLASTTKPKNERTYVVDSKELVEAQLNTTSDLSTTSNNNKKIMDLKERVNAALNKVQPKWHSNTNLASKKQSQYQYEGIGRRQMPVFSMNKIKTIQSKLSEKNIAQPNMPMANAGLYILAIFLPVIAVGIATKWEGKKVVFSLLWTLLGWLPGIIYAFIQIGKS